MVAQRMTPSACGLVPPRSQDRDIQGGDMSDQELHDDVGDDPARRDSPSQCSWGLEAAKGLHWKYLRP